jgi:hypothetical protein
VKLGSLSGGGHRWLKKSPRKKKPVTRDNNNNEDDNNNNNIMATVTFSNSLRQYHSNIPGKQEVKELIKTTILGTAYILR